MPIPQATVYILCLLTSAVCAYLLVRSYIETRTRLLLFSALCFVLLTFNNLFVVLDLFVITTFDLLPFRQLATLSAVSVLLFGFIWETE